METMFYHQASGVLEVITGPMFSGKTEELIRRVRRAKIAHKKVQIFRPHIDNRYDPSNVVSHNAQSVEAAPIQSAQEILSLVQDDTLIVAIDEVQFFEEEILSVVDVLLHKGVRVICVGLDLDYRGVPFGSMPELLAMADSVMKLSAICTICGHTATKTQRLSSSKDQVLVGAHDSYEARCRIHHTRGTLSYYSSTQGEAYESLERTSRNLS